MKVEAVRDDGALLVTDGLAALVVADGKTWLTSRDSALARGNWSPSSQPVPDSLPGEKVSQLAAYRQELEAQKADVLVPHSK